MTDDNADRGSETPAATEPADDGGKKHSESAAWRLVAIARGTYDFKISTEGEPFCVPKTGPRVVYLLRGGRHSLRAELAHSFTVKYRKVPGQAALADALLVLEGAAANEDPVPLHTRVATVGGVTYVDLGDTKGRAIQIADGCWEVIDSPPVWFRRSALTAALPEPVHGGYVRELWEHVHVREADQPLVLASLIAALIEDIPHPVLALLGEQGAGKTTAARRLVSLVDPSPATVRKPPRDQEAWITAAAGSWIVALDNLSDVPDWLSDSLCRAVSGEGDVRRRLYSDADLHVFAFRRAVILTGIDVGALRGDLADRLIGITLDPIEEVHRRDDAELEQAWIEAYPRILGALCNGAAQVLAAAPSVQLERRPRMADYARIVAAVDQLLGTHGLEAYRDGLTSMLADSLTADPFVAAMAEQYTIVTEATAGMILQQCEPVDKSNWRPPKGWPANPRAVTQLLRRHAPALRKVGWVVDDLGAANKMHATKWRLKAPGETSGPAT